MSFWGMLIIWGVCLLLFDVHRRILPNALTLPALVLAVGWSILNDPTLLWGALLWGGIYLLLAYSIGGIGGGDIKLAPTLGVIAAHNGIGAVVAAIGLASVLTLVFGVAARYLKRSGSERVPHGPGMLIATCVALCL